MTSDLRLHGYWRSTASYRVRIALNLKGLRYSQIAHDLRRGEQRSDEYLSLAPQGLVPALETADGVVTQSLAILEWMEERWPAIPLLPVQGSARALVRSMAALIACDIHPLNNVRVLNALREEFAATDAQVRVWISRWICLGFTALEAMITSHGGVFAFGDSPTLADCCLVPQVYSARRFNVDLVKFPRIQAVSDHALAQKAFAAASPDQQPDAIPNE